MDCYVSSQLGVDDFSAFRRVGAAGLRYEHDHTVVIDPDPPFVLTDFVFDTWLRVSSVGFRGCFRASVSNGKLRLRLVKDDRVVPGYYTLKAGSLEWLTS